MPGIKTISACMQVPSSEIRDVGPVTVLGMQEDPDAAPMMDMQIVDPDFIEMMGISFVAGRNFTSGDVMGLVPEFNDSFSVNQYLATTPRAYLINETGVKQLGWQDPADAIGQQIKWSIGEYELAYGPIMGVVRDYHQETLKNQVDPTVIVIEPLWLQNFLIKVETKNLEKTLSGIELIWNELFPYAMEHTFLDELFSRLYNQDRIQLKILSFDRFVTL